MEELTAASGYGITEGQDWAFTACEKLKYWASRLEYKRIYLCNVNDIIRNRSILMSSAVDVIP